MRRQRGMSRALMLLFLFGALAFVSAVELTGDGYNNTFKLAETFESIPHDKETAHEEDIVALSEKVVPLPVEEEQRDLRPQETSTVEERVHIFTSVVPYGGAFVAIEATVLLVGGATIAVLFIAKIKRRFSVAHYEDEEDPMLQSLLYSDMDYAAI